MSRRRVSQDYYLGLKRNQSLSMIPPIQPASRVDGAVSRPGSPSQSASSRGMQSPGQKTGSPAGSTHGYDFSDDDDGSVMSGASGLGSIQSEYSHRSHNSGGSRRSQQFKERVDRKLVKPDYTYKYACKSDDNQSQWVADFQKPLEEFIYPSLQIKEKETCNKKFLRGVSTKQFYDTNDEPSVQVRECNIEYPKWKHIHVDTATKQKEDLGGERSFRDDLQRGEKFIRENLQRNFHRRLKQEADAEKRKLASSTALKKAKEVKTKLDLLESGIGAMLGTEATLFLPKPADEVYKSLITNSRTKVNTSSLFKRALNKISTQTATERVHGALAPQVYEMVGEQDKHLADGLLLYQIRNKLALDAKEEEKLRQKHKENAKKGLYKSGNINKVTLRRRNSQALLEENPSVDEFAKTNETVVIPPTPTNVIGGTNDIFGFEDSEKIASDLSRIHRAVDSRNIGFEFTEVIENFGGHDAPRISDSAGEMFPFGGQDSFSFPAETDTPIVGTENQKDVDGASSVSAAGLHISTSGDSFLPKRPPNTFYDSKPGTPILPGSFYSFQASPDGHLPRSTSALPGHVLTTQTSRIFQKDGRGRVSNLHLPVVAGGQDEETDFQKKVRARDVLLMNQLRSGLIPERLLKRIPNSRNLVVLHLSHFGLGDELGMCLGGCLSSLSMLDALGLCANRLTGKSISVILENLNVDMLNHIDLSENDMRGKATDSLVKLLSKENKLHILELSQTKLGLRDFSKLCIALAYKSCVIEELCISRNNLTAGSAKKFADLLVIRNNSLKWVDASWNSFDGTAGAYIADALKSNNSLNYLDLSSNSLRDAGGQELAACLEFNKTLKVLLLNINGIGGNACFVFSKTLAKHPSMKQIDLSMNPLGEPGARALFRMILKGINCYVHMKNCTYPDDPLAFNHSNPALLSPYVLNLKEPYHNAVFCELLLMFKEGHNCRICSLSHRPEGGGKEVSYTLAVKNGEIVTKNNGYYWEPPESGTVRVDISYEISIPSEENAIDNKSFKIMIDDIILQAKSDSDRKHYLWLICMDCFFTTAQAQKLIDTLRKKNLIEVGAITLVNIVQFVWENIVDTANKHDFLCNNLDEEQKLELGYGITFEKLKFNYLNATGHWRLDMANRVQRNVMMQLLALNNIESQFSEKSSRRGDTSQKGNYSNFRNERLNRTQETTISVELITSLGYSGILEFDYVSTTRPSKTDVPTISNSELDLLFTKLGLSPRRRLPNAKAIFKLLELQIAVTKYYFTTSNVLTFMDCFMQDDVTQAKVAIALFSRLKDLENFHIILRNLRAGATKIVYDSLGLLNVINPMMPAHDYKISLKYADNRIFLHSMVTLASNEGGDMVKEYSRTEVLMINLFAAMGRIIQDAQDKYVLFGYCEIGERICTPIWDLRKNLVKLFLVGTHPIDAPHVFRAAAMYKELEEAKALANGPLDIQYNQYLKKKKKESSDKQAIKKPRGAQLPVPQF